MSDLLYWMSPISPLTVHWNKHCRLWKKSISKLNVFPRREKSLFLPWKFQFNINILSCGDWHILPGCHFFTGQYGSLIVMSKQNSHAGVLIPMECLGKQPGRHPKNRSSCPTRILRNFFYSGCHLVNLHIEKKYFDTLFQLWKVYSHTFSSDLLIINLKLISLKSLVTILQVLPWVMVQCHFQIVPAYCAELSVFWV